VKILDINLQRSRTLIKVPFISVISNGSADFQLQAMGRVRAALVVFMGFGHALLTMDFPVILLTVCRTLYYDIRKEKILQSFYI
jgi:hypothetical protein